MWRFRGLRPSYDSTPLKQLLGPLEILISNLSDLGTHHQRPRQLHSALEPLEDLDGRVEDGVCSLLITPRGAEFRAL